MARRIALLFPGQGSETIGMGLAVADAFPRAAQLLALASDACGVDLRRALDRGGRALLRTEALQPALVAVSLGVARLAESRGLVVHAVAGHSLGELSAAAYALDLRDEDAIALAALRGRLMGAAADARPGGLLAVRGTGDAAIAPALACGLVLALTNTPTERVLGGSAAHLAEALRAVPSATRLTVAGAWHTPAMEPAVAPFRDALLASLPERAPRVALVREDGVRTTNRAQLADALARSVARPVDWPATLEALVTAGATDLVAVAPGRVARAFARQTLGTRVTLRALEEPGDLADR